MFSRLKGNSTTLTSSCLTITFVTSWFCSVVWGGAARVHMERIERVQHKFLIWLCSRCRLSDVSLEYDDLFRYFGLTTLAARRTQHDLMFIRNIQNQSVESSFLLECFPLAVPTRALRTRSLFHVPYARVGTIKSGMFCRLPLSCNAFLDTCRDIDVWNFSAGQFKKCVISYVKSRSG